MEHRIRAVRPGEIVRAEFGALSAFSAIIGKAFQLGHVEIALDDSAAHAALAAEAALATQRQCVAVYPILKNRVCPRELRPRLGIFALFAAAPALSGGDHHIVDRCGAFRDLELAGAGEDYPLVQILRRLRLCRGEAHQCAGLAVEDAGDHRLPALHAGLDHLLVPGVEDLHHSARPLRAGLHVHPDGLPVAVVVRHALGHVHAVGKGHQRGIAH